MAKNADLSNAKNAKKDEFYTQLEDINAEMVHCGHTEESNCQMLCKWHNGHKSDS